MRAFLRRAHSPSSPAQSLAQPPDPQPSTTSNGGLLAPPRSPHAHNRLDRPSSSGSLASRKSDIGYAPSTSPSASPLDGPTPRRPSGSRREGSAEEDRRHRRRRSIGLLHSVINGGSLAVPNLGPSPGSSPKGRSEGHGAPDWGGSSSHDSDVDAAPSYYSQALKRGLLAPQPVNLQHKPLPSHPPPAASALASRELRKQRSSSPTRGPGASPRLPPLGLGVPMGRVRSKVEEWEANSRFGSEHGHGSASTHQAHLPRLPPPPMPPPPTTAKKRYAPSHTFSTQNLAAQLNELAVAFADGLLDPDEYRILRQGIFDRMAGDSEPEVPETIAVQGIIGSRMSLEGSRPAKSSLLNRDHVGSGMPFDSGPLVDDGGSSIYESAHSHRSNGGRDGKASNGPGSLFSQVVAAVRKNGSGTVTRTSRGLSVSSGGSGGMPRTRRLASSDAYPMQEALPPYGGLPNGSANGHDPAMSWANANRARSGSNSGSMRGVGGGRTSAASTHSRPSIMGGSLFQPPTAIGGGPGSEVNSIFGGGSVLDSQRSAFVGGSISGGGGSQSRERRVGSLGTGSISGSWTGERNKVRKGSAASSNELEHRFRAARAAAVGMSLPSLERTPSIRSKAGSIRLPGESASMLSVGRRSIQGGPAGGSIGPGGTSGDNASVHLYSDSKSMISRVSTAASATASGLFGADYAQKSSAEIQAEISVVEEEGVRMLDNFDALEQAALGKAFSEVSPELVARILEARKRAAKARHGGGGASEDDLDASNTSTLRRSASLSSSDGWINTIRAAARDRRRSVTDNSGSIFSAFTFGRGKKDKTGAGGSPTSTYNGGRSRQSSEMGDTQDTLMPDAYATVRAGSGGGNGGNGGLSLDSSLTGSRRSRTGSLTGRTAYPPPSASALWARGLPRQQPPSSYRLGSTGPGGGGASSAAAGSGPSSRTSMSGPAARGGTNGSTRSDAGHGSSTDADLDPVVLHRSSVPDPSSASSTMTTTESDPLRRLLGGPMTDALDLDPIAAAGAASLVAELDDIDARKAAVLKRYEERSAYLQSQLQSARIREKLLAR